MKKIKINVNEIIKRLSDEDYIRTEIILKKVYSASGNDLREMLESLRHTFITYRYYAFEGDYFAKTMSVLEFLVNFDLIPMPKCIYEKGKEIGLVNAIDEYVAPRECLGGDLITSGIKYEIIV